MMRPVTERSLHGLGVERNDAWRPPDRARQICNPPYIARLSSTLAISGHALIQKCGSDAM